MCSALELIKDVALPRECRFTSPNNSLTLHYIFNGYQMLFEASDRVIVISCTLTKNSIRQSDFTRRDRLMEETSPGAVESWESRLRLLYAPGSTSLGHKHLWRGFHSYD